jgi:group II intron reverse transcriptase/maturase
MEGSRVQLQPRPSTARSGSLRSQITSIDSLTNAWKRVELNRGAAGVDGVSIQEFAVDATQRLKSLQKRLMNGRYEPLPPRLFAAPKRSGGVRRIAILCIDDRIVQQAVFMALQPLLQPLFPECSYAYRPGVSAHHALRHIDALLNSGCTWAAETDIEDFFDSISHKILLDKLGGQVPDSFVLSLVSRSLASSATLPGVGIPQGAATSPLLSNLYLAEFDGHMLASARNPVRYGDDLLFVVGRRWEAQQALAEASGFLNSRLKLSLNGDKTSVVSSAQGFNFLGYRFSNGRRKPSPESVARLQERLSSGDDAANASLQRGWNSYYRTTGTSSAKRDLVSMDESHLARFIQLFGGRPDHHAEQIKSRFVPLSGALTVQEAEQHLSGSRTFATYLVHDQASISCVVLDLDVIDRPLEGIEPHGIQAVVELGQKVLTVCKQLGIPASLEDSGRRGCHLWIFFSRPVPADKARQMARLISSRAGLPLKTVRLEILPRHSDWPGPELGDAIKIPLGVHPVTGRRCHFLDESGVPIVAPEEALDQIKTMDPSNLIDVLGELTLMSTSPVDDVSCRDEVLSSKKTAREPIALLTQGCTVIQGIVSRARETGHLRHTHNLILLYTAGRLGESGGAFVHSTVGLCQNYEQRICQGYLDRLDAAHAPITCRRIREWLEEEGETHLCTCGGNRKSPLDILGDLPSRDCNSRNNGKHRVSAKGASALPTEKDASLRVVWNDVAKDLFEKDAVEEAAPDEARDVSAAQEK